MEITISIKLDSIGEMRDIADALDTVRTRLSANDDGPTPVPGRRLASKPIVTSAAKVEAAVKKVAGLVRPAPPPVVEEDETGEDEEDIFGDVVASASDDEQAEDEEVETEVDEEPTPAPKKRGRPPKSTTESAAPAGKPAVHKAATKWDLDKDVVPTFRAYFAAKGSAAAEKLLANFKVATIRKVLPAQYGEVMKLMGAG